MPPPDGILVEGGNMYLSEFPPGKAITKVGLPEKETISDLLDDLANKVKPSGTGSPHIQVIPN